MSIMVGTGRGASVGVLLRNGEALEVLSKVDTLLVDKTGTLTEGKPKLTSVVCVPPLTGQDILGFAAGLEAASEHPLASAILTGARERGAKKTQAEDFQYLPGEGVTGEMEGNRVLLGNARLMSGESIDTAPLEQDAESLRRKGETVMYVAVDGSLAGLLGVSDPIRETTAEAVDALKGEGVRIVMATGDNPTTAAAVAGFLGIEDIRAGLMPVEKTEIVQQLQREGRTVAMAGDGVNDAPALAQADVGIAMGTGTDVAMESAGVTLVKGDLRGVARARRLSRAVMRNIRQNLFFAFFYNSLGVPVAAGILYPVFGILLSPMLAAAAMTFSSVSVISNALRLRNVRL